jgi:hypothetical protein
MNQYQKILHTSVLRISFYITGMGSKLQLPWDTKWSEICESPSQPNLFYCPASPLHTAHSVVKRKNLFTIVFKQSRTSGNLYSTFHHYFQLFSKNFKGTVSQDFSKTYSCFCSQKKEVRKSLFYSFLKNFQRSKIITDIYRFPSGLDTTYLFQIQASTKDSKKTYSEDRLCFVLPLPRALPHMWIRGNGSIAAPERLLEVKICTPFFRIASWALVPKSPFV